VHLNRKGLTRASPISATTPQSATDVAVRVNRYGIPWTAHPRSLDPLAKSPISASAHMKAIPANAQSPPLTGTTVRHVDGLPIASWGFQSPSGKRQATSSTHLPIYQTGCANQDGLELSGNCLWQGLSFSWSSDAASSVGSVLGDRDMPLDMLISRLGHQALGFHAHQLLHGLAVCTGRYRFDRGIHQLLEIRQSTCQP
jgi:hypothetical protein